MPDAVNNPTVLRDIANGTATQPEPAKYSDAKLNVVDTTPDASAIDLGLVYASWFPAFAQALTAADLDTLLSTLDPTAVIKDSLVFSPNQRALEGHRAIKSYLSSSLSLAQIQTVDASTAPLEAPEVWRETGVAGNFNFTTARGRGRGRAHLVKSGDGEWKALAVYFALRAWTGHEEGGPDPGIYEGHTKAWEDVCRERQAELEKDPLVVILGAGQTGLNIAARFAQMRIPSIVLERNVRVGDNWRSRYPTLSLHTPKTHHPLLYQPFPKNWPTYTPRDKVADWLEQYVSSQDLLVWTSSTILPTPTYSREDRRWDIIVDRAGTQVSLRPRHIVVAVGTIGKPFIPDVGNEELFSGTTLHASEYMGGAPFSGKNVLVVGAGNTSADICQDLCTHQAQSVTMLQRSSTCVISAATVARAMSHVFPAALPTTVSDFKFFSLPLALERRLAKERTGQMWEQDKDLFDGLREKGLKLNMGRDGSGQHLLIFERFGGFWIDVGAAKLIKSGKLKVKNGVELTRFKEDGVVFTDGSEMKADVVVYATGYHSSLVSLKSIFGSEVIDRTQPIWGQDDEGEVMGCYRPSGVDGLWFGAGDFSLSRFCSRQLGLLIQGVELGHFRYHDADGGGLEYVWKSTSGEKT